MIWVVRTPFRAALSMTCSASRVLIAPGAGCCRGRSASVRGRSPGPPSEDSDRTPLAGLGRSGVLAQVKGCEMPIYTFSDASSPICTATGSNYWPLETSCTPQCWFARKDRVVRYYMKEAPRSTMYPSIIIANPRFEYSREEIGNYTG